MLAMEDGWVRQVGDGLVEGRAKRLESVGSQGQARGHGMSTESNNCIGEPLGYEIKAIAKVNPGDRSARPSVGLARRGERHNGAVKPLFELAGNQTDNALVPAWIRQHNHPSRRIGSLSQTRESFFLHCAFDLAALTVHGVK
jgi:hypothetical protein